MVLLALPLACSATGTTQRGTDGGASASDGDGGSGGSGGTGTTGGTGTGTTGGTGTGTTGGTTGTTGGTGNGTTGGTGGTGGNGAGTGGNGAGTGGNGTGGGTFPTTLVSSGATWRYLHEGQMPESGWKDPGFDDGSWPDGPSPLGYGDPAATKICCAYDDDYSYYFRHSFTVDDPSSIEGLKIEYKRDDGVEIFLNGNKVEEDNVAGNGSAQNVVGGAEETTWFTVDNSSSSDLASMLIAGENVVSATLYQVHEDSSDVHFDIKISAKP